MALWTHLEKVNDPSFGNCKVCELPYVTTCKCQKSDRVCANGHHWHWCPTHKRRVEEQSDHSKSSCDCQDGPMLDAEPVTDRPTRSKRDAQSLADKCTTEKQAYKRCDQLRKLIRKRVNILERDQIKLKTLCKERSLLENKWGKK